MLIRSSLYTSTRVFLLMLFVVFGSLFAQQAEAGCKARGGAPRRGRLPLVSAPRSAGRRRGGCSAGSAAPPRSLDAMGQLHTDLGRVRRRGSAGAPR